MQLVKLEKLQYRSSVNIFEVIIVTNSIRVNYKIYITTAIVKPMKSHQIFFYETIYTVITPHRLMPQHTMHSILK